MVTCKMIAELSHYLYCFLKQGLMQKFMTGKLNGCIFWLKMMTYWESKLLFGIKSALIQKKNHSGSVYNKNLLKIKIKSHGKKVTDFYYQKNF